MVPWLAPAIGAASSLVGGLLGNSATSKANKTQERIWSEQRRDQLDSLQQGITWRVNDAKNAGVHPLFALGASIPTYSPQSANFQQKDYSYIRSMGQNVSQAMMAREALKNNEMTRKLTQAQIDKIQTETRLMTQPAFGNTPMDTGFGVSQPIKGQTRLPDKSKTFQWTSHINPQGEEVWSRRPTNPIGIEESPSSVIQNELSPSAPPRKARPGYRWETNSLGQMIERKIRPPTRKDFAREVYKRWTGQFWAPF